MEKQVYTLDNVPLNKFHGRIISYTIGGSITDGYILGIIQIALSYITIYMDMNSTWQGLITSSPLIGVLLGSLFLGGLSDKIGRQKIYSWNFIIVLIASVLQFFVGSPATLFVLRLILGICIGAEYAIGPVIIAEFVPAKFRGKMLTILCIMWTVGYVIASYAGAFMQRFGDECWRYMLASSAIVALIVLIIRIGMPESPRWLILHGRADEARAIIKKHFGDNVSIENVVRDVENSKLEGSKRKKGTFAALFAKGQVKRTMFAAIAWGAQTLPLFAVMSFVPMILDSLGIDANIFYTLIFNGIYLLSGIIVYLFIERFPRKTVTIWGMLAAAIPLCVLGLWANAPVGVITVCFTVHLIGNCAFGTLTAYIYPAESFPTELRTTGMGFCSAVSRLFAIFGTFALPSITDSLGIGFALVGIAVVIFIGLVITIAWAPETKGVSIDEL